jgi:hypothetical protein
MSVVLERPKLDELYCPSCETSQPEGGRLCPRDGTRLVKLAAVIDPIIGRELDGRFTVIEKLGQGGMGAVYRAHQHSVDREVAIKVVHANLMADPEAIKRFLREAKLTSKLNHPNAVGVLDFGQTEDGVFYLVMELVAGRTLDCVLAEDGVFTPARVAKVGIQVCEALEVAHAMQIVHRDLKPQNIMVMSSGRDFVKVLDFGLAKSLQRTGELTSSMTGAGGMLGTPAFFPPERVRYGTADGRSDLYSLGCVLYLLATGVLPFQADTAHDFVIAHRSQLAPRLTNVPAALADVVERLLAKNPDDRFQDAAETRDALEQAVSVRVEAAAVAASRPPTPASSIAPDPTMLVQAAPARRVRPMLVAALVVACGIAIAIGFSGGSGSRPAPVPSTSAAIVPSATPIVQAGSGSDDSELDPEIEPGIDLEATGSDHAAVTAGGSGARPTHVLRKKRPRVKRPQAVTDTADSGPAHPALPF